MIFIYIKNNLFLSYLSTKIIEINSNLLTNEYKNGTKFIIKIIIIMIKTIILLIILLFYISKFNFIFWI